jgi:hypothetical protein
LAETTTAGKTPLSAACADVWLFGLGHYGGMAKWVCKCGTTIRSSGTIPNPTQWMLMSDQDLDAFTGLVQAEDIYTNMTTAFRCPTCDRLHIFWQGWDAPATVYAPDA